MNQLDPALKTKWFRNRNFWYLAGMVILASLTSLFLFSKQSLRLDESQSLWQTSHSIPKIIQLIASDVHVPLYHLMLHAWQIVFGNDVSTARILSLIFFLLSIPTIYFLGKISYGQKAGLYAALLLTVSPFMNWYGNEIRMYSLLVFITLIHQYYFIRIFRQRDAAAWIGFAITAFFGIFTHYFFFLMLATDALFFFFNRNAFAPGSFRRFAYICGGLAVAFLPWVAYVLHLGQIGNSTPLLIAPSTVDIFNTFFQFLLGFQTDHLNTILVSLWPLTVLLGFLALRKDRRIQPVTFYFICGFLIPNVIAFIVSLLLSPVYLSRYLIFTMPMMYLLICWLLSTYPRMLSNVLKLVLVAAMITTLVVEAQSALTPVKENYREATQYLEAHATASDVIVVSAPFTIYPVIYYYKGAADVTTLPIWDQEKSGPIPPYSPAEFAKDMITIKGSHENVWVLQSYDQGYQEDVHQYFETHFTRLYQHVYSPGMTLYEYKLRYD